MTKPINPSMNMSTLLYGSRQTNMVIFTMPILRPNFKDNNSYDNKSILKKLRILKAYGYLGHAVQTRFFGHMRTLKAHISQRIRTV